VRSPRGERGASRAQGARWALATDRGIALPMHDDAQRARLPRVRFASPSDTSGGRTAAAAARYDHAPTSALATDGKLVGAGRFARSTRQALTAARVRRAARRAGGSDLRRSGQRCLGMEFRAMASYPGFRPRSTGSIRGGVRRASRTGRYRGRAAYRERTTGMARRRLDLGWRQWEQLPTFGSAPPGPRSHATLAYDPRGRRLLYFGGAGERGALFQELWTYDRSGWRLWMEGR
jgi:hypothetical protein